MRVLLVDDDPDFQALVVRGLKKAGIDCQPALDGSAARELLESGQRFDLILLDVNMPRQSGWEVMDEWRERGRDTPVIFLSGLDEASQRVRGLDVGADDYISKKAPMEELVARIKAVVRRFRSMPRVEYADLSLDVMRRAVTRGGRSIDLSPREFDLLRALVAEPGRIWTRAEILQEVWGIAFDPETNVVNVHIARLRAKLDRHGPPLIQTVKGEGYRLREPGRTISPEDASRPPAER